LAVFVESSWTSANTDSVHVKMPSRMIVTRRCRMASFIPIALA